MPDLLTEPYYSASHAVFRRATGQTDAMLEQLVEQIRPRRRVSILSVGSGAGLFEMPMLTRLVDDGIAVERFVGVDPSAHAAADLDAKLTAANIAGLEHELVIAGFEAFETTERFDVVLFNHVLEYLPDDALVWMQRSLDLLDSGGVVLMFSPNRGGINVVYEAVFTEFAGASPLFADDIERLLDRSDIAHEVVEIDAACDVSALERPGEDAEKLMLLSFLSQRDCRTVPAAVRDGYVDYYLSLRTPGSETIAHPTTLFVL